VRPWLKKQVKGCIFKSTIEPEAKPSLRLLTPEFCCSFEPSAVTGRRTLASGNQPIDQQYN
jgi:hypothetical protein